MRRSGLSAAGAVGTVDQVSASDKTPKERERVINVSILCIDAKTVGPHDAVENVEYEL